MKSEMIASYDPFIDRVTGKSAFSTLPDLKYGYIWVGDNDNKPQQTPQLLDIKVNIRTINNKINDLPKIFNHGEIKNNHVPIFTNHNHNDDKIEEDDGEYGEFRRVLSENNPNVHHHKLETGRILSEKEDKYIHSSPVNIDDKGNVGGVDLLTLNDLKFNNLKDTFIKVSEEGKIVPADLNIDIDWDKINKLEAKMEKAISLCHTFALISLATAFYKGNSYLHCQDRFVVNKNNVISHNTFNQKGFMFCDLDVNQIDDKYRSYIDGSGSLVISSSLEDKHMIKAFKPQSVLDKLNEINIYSYSPMLDIEGSEPYWDKDRKYYKSLHFEIGMLAEELKTVFPELLDFTSLIDETTVNQETFNNMTKGYVPKMKKDEYLKQKNNSEIGKGVSIHKVLCYTILGIKEIYSQIKELQKKAN